jgi:hypothetical protein
MLSDARVVARSIPARLIARTKLKAFYGKAGTALSGTALGDASRLLAVSEALSMTLML